MARAAALANLRSRGSARPRKLKTLSSTISALFHKALDDDEVTALIDALTQQGYISLEGQSVTYRLPSS